MKFVKIDTPVPLSTTATKPHSHAADHGGYMYLDDMLDKTFLTDYFLQ
jgi:hypothetical protein